MKKKEKTRIIHAGRNPMKQWGAVNPPVYHVSTILNPDTKTMKGPKKERDPRYGRRGSPTHHVLEDAINSIEGGDGCVLTPSGLSALSTALLSFLGSGDHLLMTDSCYAPTRNLCDHFLKRMGIETTYYDPLIGADIAQLIKPETKVVFVEAPGSQTFEMQDIPAIAEQAHKAGAICMLDNTWASPLFFKPFEKGVDVSVQALTKYVVGHSDAMLGSVTAIETCIQKVRQTHGDLGVHAGPDDVYLGQRGIRTLDVRMRQHMNNALELAKWLQQRDEVINVFYPALPEDPGHEIWKRDFTGASGLFAFEVEKCSTDALYAFLDNAELFGLGYSWGGYESLMIPVAPSSVRTATQWDDSRSVVRIHVGLEDVEDLKSDLNGAFDAMAKAKG